MREIETWLDTQLAPVSRIGARLGRKTLYVPGEEAAAQAAIDALLDHAAWNDEQTNVARARLAPLHDIGQAVSAAQAETIDLVDLAGLNLFLASFFTLLPTWEERVRVVAGITIDVALQAMLRHLHTLLRSGETHEGYALHSGDDATLQELRRRVAEVQRALGQWREDVLSELRAEGISSAYQADFLLVRSAQHLLEHGRIRQYIRIVRETPEFLMCALRFDARALAFVEEEQQLQREIEARERAVIDRYTAEILRCLVALDLAMRWIAALDIMLARRSFVVRYRLQRAVIAATPSFACRDAGYLPLREQLSERYMGLDVAFTSMGVLSGANMGGKTNALKTVVLVLACAARGLPVPAQEATCALYDRFVWFGEDTEDHEAGLSAFGHEMEAVRRLCTLTGVRSFIVFDEFARTTTPREGRALSIAVFRGLLARGAALLAATHLDHVAEHCGAVHYRLVGIRADHLRAEPEVLSPQALLRRLEDAFDRRFVLVDHEFDQTSSQALEVASAIGLPDDVLRDAYKEFSP